jgi:uncharacterized protein YndB with AHSA1/START domain
MGVRVNHRSFVIERQLPGRPAHAFRFWSDHQLKRRWNSCHPDWEALEDRFHFDVGGGETVIWRMPDGTEQEMVAHFLEIVPADRLVYAYVMHSGGETVSSSLVTVEFTARAEATTMTYTEQAVFRSVADGDVREAGTGVGFERLREILADDLTRATGEAQFDLSE